MATSSDNIRLSLDIYETVSRIASGWQRVAQSSKSGTGFFGAAYKQGDDIVIAFRGWNDANPNDAANVLATYVNTPFPQMDDAQKFINAVRAANPGANISLTGHSLGGALAAIMAVRNGLTAETFGQNEWVDAAFKSMNGYKEKIFGITIWDIAPAPHNTGITRAGLDAYAGVVNHVMFGEIAAYNNRSDPNDFIGSDDVLGASFANGILADDSRFGRWLGLTGDVWEELVPVAVDGAPYTVDFSAQIHSLGFTALPLLFPADMANLTAALPRMVLQLTNDWLARDSQGLIPYRLPYDAIDKIVLDHLVAPAGQATERGGLFGDLHDIADAGVASSARADADINTALLQLAIQHAARETLDYDATVATGGTINDHGSYLSVSLRTDLAFAAEGERVARDYGAWLLSGTIGRAASGIDATSTLFVEAGNGVGAVIPGSAGNDLMFGGGGADAISALGGNDVGFGFGGNDTMDGGAGNDVLAGGARIDALKGGAGNDRLFGQAGNDSIAGGDGNDWIEGGANTDALYGNADADVFDFNRGSGVDRIYDFTNDVDELHIDSSYGFAGAAAVVAATSTWGSNALIALGRGNYIYLMGYLSLNTIASLADDVLIG